MRPSSLNTLRLSHLSAASRPRCCVEAPEGNSAPRMCPGWHRSGAEPPLTACFALPPSRPGATSLRGQHPAAVASLRAPGWSFVRHSCNFNSQRGGLRAASGNSALPWDGPSGVSGGQTGEWASLVPLGETCPGAKTLVVGKDASVCLLLRKQNLALGVCPRPLTKAHNWVISRSLTVFRAPGLPDGMAQPCPAA